MVFSSNFRFQYCSSRNNTIIYDWHTFSVFFLFRSFLLFFSTHPYLFVFILILSKFYIYFCVFIAPHTFQITMHTHHLRLLIIWSPGFNLLFTKNKWKEKTNLLCRMLVNTTMNHRNFLIPSLFLLIKIE